VIGLPHEDLGSIPHADAGLSEPLSDEQLMTYLCRRLAPHKLPWVIERVTMPLRGEAGKVRRPARAERDRGGAQPSANRPSPPCQQM
jgi:bile acid-coenzyme A ligase